TCHRERRVDRRLLIVPARAGAVRRVRRIPTRVVVVVGRRREGIGQLVDQDGAAYDVAGERTLEIADRAVREQLRVGRRVHGGRRQRRGVRLGQRREVAARGNDDGGDDRTESQCLKSH